MKSILLLTDHTTHIEIDSFYELVNAMVRSKLFGDISIASRGVIENKKFFVEPLENEIYIHKVNNYIYYGYEWDKNLIKIENFDFDVVMLRVDQPINNNFLTTIEQKNKTSLFINSPRGMIRTNNKDFLLNISTFTPTSIVSNSVSEILQISKDKEIVIKPLNSYGGKGIAKIYKNDAYIENNKVSVDEFTLHLSNLIAKDKTVLVMDYLKNVFQGDKRILVVHGHILGAILRTPASNSWICNLSSGAKVIQSHVDEDEINIIKSINSILEKNGIVIYGIDTLVDNNGKRVLSEINTANVGGFVQLEKFQKQPILDILIQHLYSYIKQSNNF